MMETDRLEANAPEPEKPDTEPSWVRTLEAMQGAWGVEEEEE